MITVPLFEYPTAIFSGNATPVSVNALTLNSSGFKAAAIFRVSKAGNIHKVGLRLGTKTTGQDTDVRVETVSAQFPSGTLWGTNTNGTILSATLTANVMNMATLTADAAVVVGDLIAVVFAPTSSPSYQITYTASNLNQLLPYMAFNNGSWASNSNTGAPICAVEYDDGTYATQHGLFPISSSVTDTFNSGSTPDEIGAKFTIPFGCRVRGYWVAIDLDNTTSVVLYDTDGVSVLATTSITSDGRGNAGGRAPHYGYFSSAQPTLAVGGTYYLSVKPGASSVTTYALTMASAAAMNQLPGGTNWQYVSAKDPSGTGSWTPVTTQYPMIGLLLDGIADAASGGGRVIGGGF